MRDLHFSKKFLNKDGYLGIAAILTGIHFGEGDKQWHTIELKISDCRNEINLDLTLDDTDSNNTYANSMHKIETLISELTLLRDKMYEGKVEFERRKAILEEKNKQKAEEKIDKTQGGLLDAEDFGISSPNY